MEALKKIGQLWNKKGEPTSALPSYDAPIISSNKAKFKNANSSWSNDMWIMDFANDDDFHTSWQSHPNVKNPWYELDLGSEQPFDMISITENSENIKTYTIQYFANEKWHELLNGDKTGKVKVHRFSQVWGNKIKITITNSKNAPSIAEMGVYNERR